jgi:hypothetical protein
MNRRIMGVVAGLAVAGGVVAVSAVVAAPAAADGVRITNVSEGRAFSSSDSSIFTVNYGLAGDQSARDQSLVSQGREFSLENREF